MNQIELQPLFPDQIMPLLHQDISSSLVQFDSLTNPKKPEVVLPYPRLGSAMYVISPVDFKTYNLNSSGCIPMFHFP